MIERDIEKMLSYMTSFYKDHLPVDSSYEKLLRVYIKSFLPMWEETTYLQKVLVLDDTPTLRKVHYAKIPISEAMYTDDQAERITQLSTFEQKIRELDKIGGFVEFTFSELGSRQPKVYDGTFKLRFSDEEPLENYTDYFIRDNKFYILPDLILSKNRIPKEIHGFDIRVDDMMLEKKWGTFFNVEAGPLLPRTEYRKVLSAFRRLLGSRMTIKDIRESVIGATGWETFDILDAKSPGLSESIKKMYDEYKISPAKFVIMIPEGLAGEKLKLNIVLSMLDEVKEEQTNYVMFFDITRTDFLEKLGDESHVGMQMLEEDVSVIPDNVSVGQSFSIEERLFPRYNIYDEYNHFDNKLKFDAPDHSHLETKLDSEFVTMDDEEHTFDAEWGVRIEWSDVRHIDFPEIPRQLTAAADGDSLTFTFNTNADGTSGYELWGSEEEYGTYVLLEDVPPSETGSTSIIHNASGSEVRYYKVKAKAGAAHSLFTLPVDRTTL